MPFSSRGLCITDLFVTEQEFIDRFVGQQLWLWGAASSGALGQNAASTLSRSSPVQTVSGATEWRTASAGYELSAGIKDDGTLWIWGRGDNGAIGDNNRISRSSPVQTLSSGTNWRSVSLGNTVASAIKNDGTLWLWGNNSTGQLGDGTAVLRSSPIQTIAGGTNWRQVSLGCLHTGAVKADGTLWMWGDGRAGILGNESEVDRSSPVQTVSGGTNWKQVSLGRYHTGAIKTDGTLWMWGCGDLGLLGTNTIVSVSSPVQTVTGGTNWKSISAGNLSTASIKTDGTLWVWGRNTRGELGDNTTITRSSPVQTVSGGTNWKEVSVANFTGGSAGSSVSGMMSLKTDGTLWTWGSAGSGELGDNNRTADRSSPVQTVSTGTEWRIISAGDSHRVATKIIE